MHGGTMGNTEKRVVICDLGRVIMPLMDMYWWWQELHFMSTWHTKEDFETAKKIALEVAWKPFERGEMSEDEFQILFRRILCLMPMNPQAFWHHYVNITKGINEPLVECLRAMRERGVVLALLSNIDKARRDHIAKNDPALYDQATAHFHYVFFSYSIGSRKPEPKIYRYAVKEISTLPQHIYYLDDYMPNIEGMAAAIPDMPRENMLLYAIDKHEEAVAFLRNHELMA